MRWSFIYADSARAHDRNTPHSRHPSAVHNPTLHPHSRPKRIPRRTQVWKTLPFSRILDEKNASFSTEIADFGAQ